jgi:uncharacterized membrane protein (UPF0127 family)
MRFVALAMLLFAAGPSLAEAPLEKLDIVTAGGPRHFAVEVMRTEPERERGLMFRKSMAADHGMLFDFDTAAPVMMWMKNTYLSLDMVFIGADGRVISTAENAEPLSERIIPSGGNALAVLEVNAGTVARLGIKAGDRVDNAMFHLRSLARAAPYAMSSPCRSARGGGRVTTRRGIAQPGSAEVLGASARHS